MATSFIVFFFFVCGSTSFVTFSHLPSLLAPSGFRTYFRTCRSCLTLRLSVVFGGRGSVRPEGRGGRREASSEAACRVCVSPCGGEQPEKLAVRQLRFLFLLRLRSSRFSSFFKCARRFYGLFIYPCNRLFFNLLTTKEYKLLFKF